ncbi:MAG TPA: cyclic nucleotide-binding domain-containing protein, partial [Actinomycetota bacterium]|nr:cyclic nucleotide-binding domain-containing protein [Actinomycetota bacterium]
MHHHGSTVLDSLTEPERERLLGRAVERRLGRGEALAHAGAPAERVHVVTGGVVKLVGRDADGGETILGLCLPGEVAGAVAAVDARPHP